VRAFAQSCGLPELQGKPPFGGPVLSHDYVEAALLARAGYEVQLDTAIDGSFEEGPDNIVDFAKRDQRWCQGNLQHSRVLLAPSFRLWNRITLLQGIFTYLMPPIWLVLLVVSIASADMAKPSRATPAPGWAGWVLIGFVAAILILPKLLIGLGHMLSGAAGGLKGSALLLLSVVAEIALSTLTAPIVLMFQVRAVLRVLFGFDGGWPPSNRADGVLSLSQAWTSSWWIACCGGAGLAAVTLAGPALAVWSLPVALPMIVSPLIIAITSLPSRTLDILWQVGPETTASPVLAEWQEIHDRWANGPHLELESELARSEEAVNVLG
jgi:membrane glycosyltransferase